MIIVLYYNINNLVYCINIFYMRSINVLVLQNFSDDILVMQYFTGDILSVIFAHIYMCRHMHMSVIIYTHCKVEACFRLTGSFFIHSRAQPVNFEITMFIVLQVIGINH